MREFSFKGSISASKSIMNRALIIKSYHPEIKLRGSSTCDDVVLMAQSLHAFEKGQTSFECGHAGTVLRFLALRVSRRPGEYFLKASSRLMSRPQNGLYQILDQLKVPFKVTAEGLQIRSSGWQSQSVVVDGGDSSQFLSSVLLNAWDLPEDLVVSLKDKIVSRAYFHLTEKLIHFFGMKVESIDNQTWKVLKHQHPRTQTYQVEPDMSSCFAIAAAAAVSGQCEIENFPENSWQPDFVFCDVLTKMNATCLRQENSLQVRKGSQLAPIELDVNNCPDVVPVLSVLMAQAEGISKITGFSHLIHKESNRLKKVQELLTLLGRDWKIENNQFFIYGKAQPFKTQGTYDPDQDHRMAMAAQIANLAGAQLHILHQEVVDKSFPEFWKIVGPS